MHDTLRAGATCEGEGTALILCHANEIVLGLHTRSEQIAYLTSGIEIYYFVDLLRNPFSIDQNYRGL